jgi:hypothetical protein
MWAMFNLQMATLIAALTLVPLLANAADLPKPGASAAEIRAEFGAPTAIHPAAGRKEIWEYAGKPSPYQTYFLVFSKNRRLETIRQVINDETFGKVKAGMTLAQIRGLLGTPWRITDWDDDADSNIADMLEYRGQDAGGTYKFHIEFDKRGRVVLAAKVRDITGNDHRNGEPVRPVEAAAPKP